MNIDQAAEVRLGRERRLLLVDDDVVQLKLVKLQLEAAGFVVEAVAGARAAFERLRDGDVPAAIVSDIVMDDIDGFTLCRKLRSDSRIGATPVVLLSSAFDEDDDRELAYRVGANALVARTANQQDCIAALLDCLDNGSAAPTTYPSRAPDLYAHRMAHQLAKVSEKRATAEKSYETLFTHANDAVVLVTTDGILIDVNRAFEQITGLTREELVGRHALEFAAPGHELFSQSQYAAVIDATVARTAPIPIVRADGATILLEFTTTRVDLDGTPTIFGIGRDVTALVDATRKLEASERHYRSLVENVPDVIWSATNDWAFTFFSPNIFALSGFTAEELLSGKYAAGGGRVHPEDLERVGAARTSTSKHGAPLDVKYRWQHRDGRWRWIHLRGARSSTGIDGSFADITVHKELEEQLLQAQKLEAVGQLTAGIAHDFNNILAAVTMNASLLLETGAADPESELIARDILDAAQRGAELTKQLLTFSRRKPSAPRDVEVNAILGGMERMLARLVGSRITLAVAPSQEAGRVHMDPGQLEQVVMNLVVNARDAMSTRGTLEIRTANVDLGVDDAHHTPEAEPGAYVRLSVSDDGCGMDAETQRRVFEPFFTTKAEQGTGLGLATCYGIVRHAGGFISIDSEVGRGTTFDVYLPRATRPSRSDAPEGSIVRKVGLPAHGH